MRILDSIKEYIDKKIFSIEKRSDITEDEKINELIVSTSIVCAAIATQPFPGWDIFLLTPVQIYLGKKIAQVRKAKIDSISAIYEIAGAIGLGITAQQSIIFLYKFIPFWGSITSIFTVFCATYVIGKTMDFYFINKKKGVSVSSKEIKNVVKKYKEEVKNKFDKKTIKAEVDKFRRTFKNVREDGKDFLSKNIDEIAILAVMDKLSAKKLALTTEEAQVLQAAIRYDKRIFNKESAIEFFKSRSQSQKIGDANNIKGILHEMEFVKEENEDGDSVVASMFSDKNHPRDDVILTDLKTGDTVGTLQLKTGTSTSIVNEWKTKYPGNEDKLRVSEELAEKTGHKSSGFSDEELEKRTNEFVEKLENHNNDIGDVLKEFTPILTLAGTSLAIYKLHQKYKRKEIDINRLSFLILKITSLKGAKVLMIIAVLNVPIVGPAYGAKLVGSLLFKFKDFMQKTSKTRITRV